MKHFCPMCGEQWDDDRCDSCGWSESKQPRCTREPSIKQLYWFVTRGGVRWSKRPFRRFSISQTSTGYTACDHSPDTTQESALERFTTEQSAMSWCGIRVGDVVVRRSGREPVWP